LDTEKFRVAKAANELEIEGERLGSEVYGLKKQLQKLEEQGDEVESAENKAEDEVVYVLSPPLSHHHQSIISRMPEN